MSFSKEDLINHRAFKSMLELGDFEIKGRAVVEAARLFDWYLSLDKKIIGAMTPQTPIVPAQAQPPIQDNTKQIGVKKK